jgi:hypothetical protein
MQFKQTEAGKIIQTGVVFQFNQNTEKRSSIPNCNPKIIPISTHSGKNLTFGDSAYFNPLF